MKVLSALLISLALMSGCAMNQKMPTPPDENASYERRLNFYKDNRALNKTLRVSPDIITGIPQIETGYLQLANGNRVSDPRVLKKVVRKDTPTAKAIQRYESHLSAMSGFAVASGLATVGMVVGGVGGMLAMQNHSTMAIAGPLLGVAGISMLASLPILGGGILFFTLSEQERNTAFDTYNHSLEKSMLLDE